MTQIAFSHQFSNRWLAAPQQIKNAIIQELDDIVQLLDHKTELSEFKFTTPDLRSYIDTIYADLAHEKAAKLALQPQEKLAKEALIDDQEALKAAENKMRDVSSTSKTPSSGNSNDQSHHTKNKTHFIIKPSYGEPLSSQDPALNTNKAENGNDNNNKRNQENQDSNSADSWSEPKTELDKEPARADDSVTLSFANDCTEVDASLLKELETRIDDYLSEQMAIMSEDLKSWLREQVSKK